MGLCPLVIGRFTSSDYPDVADSAIEILVICPIEKNKQERIEGVEG
jgi:hypothetical protein